MKTREIAGIAALLGWLLLAGCAAAPGGVDDPAGNGGGDGAGPMEGEMRGEMVAAAEEGEADLPPGAPQMCIPHRQVRRAEPVGDHSILFYMGHGDVWRNRLRTKCPVMRARRTLSFEIRTGQLCAGDQVGVMDDWLGSLQEIGRCSLGEFEYLTEDQAEAFKQIR